jgi:hypothetical protein
VARYVVNTTLGSRVARLNPTWNQPYTDEALDAGFAKAMELTGGCRPAAAVFPAGVMHAVPEDLKALALQVAASRVGLDAAELHAADTL